MGRLTGGPCVQGASGVARRSSWDHVHVVPHGHGAGRVSELVGSGTEPVHPGVPDRRTLSRTTSSWTAWRGLAGATCMSILKTPTAAGTGVHSPLRGTENGRVYRSGRFWSRQCRGSTRKGTKPPGAALTASSVRVTLRYGVLP